MSTSTVTIVGGGLAGLALGVALRRRGIPVTLHDAGKYPRHRVCGEFIAGLSKDTLRSLWLEEIFEHSLRSFRARWWLGDRIVSQFELPSAALCVSRFSLDDRLATLFMREGGHLVTHSRHSLDAGEGLVIASGRRRASDSPWVGLKAHIRNVSDHDKELELHLGRGAYVGLSRVEDGWTNVCGLFRKGGHLKGDSTEAWEVTLRDYGLTALAKRISGAQLRPGSSCAVAGFEFGYVASSAAEIRIGDAHAMIPPFTGHGMAMAFIGAAAVVESVTNWARGGISWSEAADVARSQLARTFNRRLSLASSLQPLLTGPMRHPLGIALKTGLVPTRFLCRCLHSI